MLSLFRRNSSSKPIIVITMIFALLLAQGLRVCIHSAVGGEFFDNTAGSTHIESDFVADHDDGGSTATKEVSLLIVLKQLGVEIKLFAVSLVLLVLLPLVFLSEQVPTRTITVTPYISFHARRPPLRAPPR